MTDIDSLASRIDEQMRAAGDPPSARPKPRSAPQMHPLMGEVHSRYAADRARDLAIDVLNAVEADPWKAVQAAGSIGFVTGLLLRTRANSRRNRRARRH